MFHSGASGRLFIALAIGVALALLSWQAGVLDGSTNVFSGVAGSAASSSGPGTLAAIADELDTHYNTVQKWAAGDRSPSNATAVKHELERLLTRSRIPKGKRYKKSPQP